MEPDLLARSSGNQMPRVTLFMLGETAVSVGSALIYAVALGVGPFLVLAVLRILFKISLSFLLIIFYLITFLLAAFTGKEFLAVAFDSGGVTTGPITVPFILALGVGIASVRGGDSPGRQLRPRGALLPRPDSRRHDHGHADARRGLLYL